MGNLISRSTLSDPMFKILRTQHSFMRFTANISVFDMPQPDSQHKKELILSIIIAPHNQEYIFTFFIKVS